MKRFSMAMTWLALAGLMTTVSCRKPVVGFTNGEARTVTISAVTESGNGSKTAIDGLNVNWSVGDQIRMNAESVLTLKEGAGTTEGVFEGPVTGDGPYRIGYPADATTYSGTTLKLSILAEWTYDTEKQIVPMVAVTNSVEGGLQFHNAVNMLKMQLKGDGTAASKLKSIVLTSTTSNLNGKINVTFNGETPEFAAIADGDGASKTMTVSFGAGLQLTADEVQCVYIPLAKISVDDVLTVRFNCANDRYMEKKVTADADFDAVNNMLYDELTVNATEGGAPTSVFTVGMEGDTPITVEFSPGNLQYLGKSDGTGTWRFAEHQWDYMGDGPNTTTGNKGNVDLGADYEGKYNTGSGNAGGSETADDKAAARDLFGWGCTGYEDTRKESHTDWYQTNYQPYSTSNSEVNDTYNYFGYGPDYYSGSEYNLTVDNNSDWGCLAIGSDPAGTWRTLSSAEWAYLFNTRTVNGGTGEGKSWRCATINSDASDGSNVNGMLLYPDGYTAQTGATSYTKADWSAMESAGVVFLPAAGERQGTEHSYGGYYGNYWACDCADPANAYHIAFGESSVYPQACFLRSSGYSVRLVR